MRYQISDDEFLCNLLKNEQPQTSKISKADKLLIVKRQNKF